MRRLFGNAMIALSRMTAVAGKELRDVWRQPKLVLALIVGPFLILLIFGTGYQSVPPPLTTVLVTQSGSQIGAQVDELQETLEPAVDIVDVTSDIDDAIRRLRDGEIDIVVATPADAIELVRNNEQAAVEVFHDKLDPFDQAYITIFTRSSVDELNRRVLAGVTSAGQERSEALDDPLPAARRSADALAVALEEEDEVAATRARIELDRALLLTERRTGSSNDLLTSLSTELGAESQSTGSVSDLRSDANAIDFDDPEAPGQARELADTLAALEGDLADFQQLDPEVLVAPFEAELAWVRGKAIPLEAFYGPGVLVVLLQHASVTLAALSMVRERSLGIDSWFRVSPMPRSQLIAGKFLGYGVLAVVISAVMTVAILSYFGLSMRGSWYDYALVIGLTIVASLALGFFVAAVSGTEAQAVQFSMLILLVTIFFSGFVLSIDRIIGPAAAISELVPASAGISGLQDVLFRGEALATIDFVRLSVYTVAALAAAALFFRRRRSTD